MEANNAAPVAIGLHIDQNDGGSFRPGDVVSGCVYLQVTTSHSAFPSMISNLHLRLVGEEHCVIPSSTSMESKKKKRRERRRRRADALTYPFLLLEYPLHSFVPRQPVAPGHYEYPFSLQLPERTNDDDVLPASMQCGEANKSHAEVRYRLVAVAKRLSATFFHSHPEAEERLTIVPASSPASPIEEVGVPSYPPPTLSRSHSHSQTMIKCQNEYRLPKEQIPVSKYCGCRRKGHMSLETKASVVVGVDKEHPHMNQVLVQLQATNLSTMVVESVRLQLEQVVEWKVHGQTERQSRILSECQLDATTRPELAALPKHQRRSKYRKRFLRWWHRYSQRRRQQQQQRSHRSKNNIGSSQDAASEAIPLQQQQEESLLYHDANGGCSVSHHTSHHGGDDIEEPYCQVPPLGIPEDTLDTYTHGNHLQVRHVLSVRLQTNGKCATNPEQAIWIQLGRPRPQKEPDEMDEDDDYIPAPITARARTTSLHSTGSAAGHHYDLDIHNNMDHHADNGDDTSISTMRMIMMLGEDSHRGTNDDDDLVPVLSDTGSSSSEDDEDVIPLPEDWNPILAPTVDIPLAQAIVLDRGGRGKKLS